MSIENIYYRGNSKLTAAGVQQQFTPEQIFELDLCINDPVYFIKKYVKIIHVDHGLMPFTMWKFQEDIVNLYHNNRHVALKLPRQCGKTQTTASFILHYILFNEQKTVAILANKGSTAKEIISRIKTSYEELPHWLQVGIVEWNKHSILLANGSRVVAAATSSSAIRGMSISLLYLDEFAFLHPNMAMEFFESVYPTVSSGTETKILISSTPKGLNHFYKMYTDAVEGKSEFKAYEINWYDVPGRDEAWKQKTIATIGQLSWEQEYECSFAGSANTLISGAALKEMVASNPIAVKENLKIWAKPVISDNHPSEDHVYIMTVDCSEGVGADFTVANVIDVTNYPFKQVAQYRNNLISPLHLPDILVPLAKMYNNAWMLIEINSAGKQVGDMVRFDYEYENILMTSVNERRRQQLMFGSGSEMIPGVRTTKAVKKIGCSHLKHLIENNKLLIQDAEAIFEFSNFIRKGDSFSAEEGYHDDIVMSFVIFAWLVNQDFFKEITNTDVRKQMYAQLAERFDDELPMIFSTHATEEQKIVFGGAVWQIGS